MVEDLIARSNRLGGDPKKREVVPENVADAVYVLTGPELSRTTGLLIPTRVSLRLSCDKQRVHNTPRNEEAAA